MNPIRYILDTPRVVSKDLMIRGIGIQETMEPQFVDRPRGTEDYLFMAFYDEVWIRVGKREERHPAGTIMMWDQRQGHFYGNRQRRWTHSWIHCDGAFIRRQLKKNLIPMGRPILLPNPSMMEKYLFDLHSEFAGYTRPGGVILENLIENWIHEISRILDGRSEGEAIPIRFLELKSYIETHAGQPMTLDGLACRTHLSVPHLCSLFKKYFGTSVIGYLIQQRLQQAAYLLQDPTLGITEIAGRVGYEDIYHFSKLFKNHFGMSPRKMRQRALLSGHG